MDVLIAVASKHGATMEIGEAIAAVLRSHSLGATVAPAEDVASLDGYDAVVLGSGVYAGHWMKSASHFVDHFVTELTDRPVWLFSSGPIGDPPKPNENPAEAFPTVARINAREHRVFPGRIDAADLGLAERALVKIVRAPAGDYRSWDDISDWAASIATALVEPDAKA